MKIRDVVISSLTTTILWEDGTTTVVSLKDNDSFDEEKGILWAIAKRFLGSSTAVQDALDMRRIEK